MVTCCCVPMCKNTQKIKGISFHKFPVDKKLFKEWVRVIRRDERKCAKISRHMMVCSAHFRPDDFLQRPYLLLKRLKPNVVPSIFAFNKKIEKPQRKLPSYHPTIKIMPEVNKEKHVAGGCSKTSDGATDNETRGNKRKYKEEAISTGHHETKPCFLTRDLTQVTKDLDEQEAKKHVTDDVCVVISVTPEESQYLKNAFEDTKPIIKEETGDYLEGISSYPVTNSPEIIIKDELIEDSSHQSETTYSTCPEIITENITLEETQLQSDQEVLPKPKRKPKHKNKRCDFVRIVDINDIIQCKNNAVGMEENEPFLEQALISTTDVTTQSTINITQSIQSISTAQTTSMDGDVVATSTISESVMPVSIQICSEGNTTTPPLHETICLKPINQDECIPVTATTTTPIKSTRTLPKILKKHNTITLSPKVDRSIPTTNMTAIKDNRNIEYTNNIDSSSLLQQALVPKLLSTVNTHQPEPSAIINYTGVSPHPPVIEQSLLQAEPTQNNTTNFSGRLGILMFQNSIQVGVLMQNTNNTSTTSVNSPSLATISSEQQAVSYLSAPSQSNSNENITSGNLTGTQQLLPARNFVLDNTATNSTMYTKPVSEFSDRYLISCPSCCKYFATRHEFYEHVCVATNAVKPDNTATNSTVYTKPVSEFSDRYLISCASCCKCFATRNEFNEHVCVTTNAVKPLHANFPSSLYECSKCTALFVQKKSLECHACVIDEMTEQQKETALKLVEYVKEINTSSNSRSNVITSNQSPLHRYKQIFPDVVQFEKITNNAATLTVNDNNKSYNATEFVSCNAQVSNEIVLEENKLSQNSVVLQRVDDKATRGTLNDQANLLEYTDNENVFFYLFSVFHPTNVFKSSYITNITNPFPFSRTQNFVIAANALYNHICQVHMITCDETNKEYLNFIEVVTNETTGPLKCIFCKAVFIDVDNYSQHMRLQHSESDKGGLVLRCKLCHMCYKKVLTLKKHLETHQEWKQLITKFEPYECSDCLTLYLDCMKIEKCSRDLQDENYFSLKNLIFKQRHRCYGSYTKPRLHFMIKFKHSHGIDQGLYFCLICERDAKYTSFLTKSQLFDHIKSHKDISFRCCHICFIKFNTIKEYYEHCVTCDKHKMDKDPLSCELNVDKFTNPLEKKVETDTCILKPFKCKCAKNCNNCFHNICSLKAHVIYEHFLKPFRSPMTTTDVYTCPICSVVFDDSKLFFAHCPSFLTLELKLRYCTKHFNDPHNMQCLHIMAETSCTICSSKFYNSQQLLYHMENEHNEKMIYCSRCKSNIPHTTFFNNHFDTCYSLVPQHCPLCGVCYPNKQMLKNHIKTEALLTSSLYQCKFCLNYFSSSMNHCAHLLAFRCQECSVTSCDNNLIQEHMREAHNTFYSKDITNNSQTDDTFC